MQPYMSHLLADTESEYPAIQPFSVTSCTALGRQPVFVITSACRSLDNTLPISMLIKPQSPFRTTGDGPVTCPPVYHNPCILQTISAILRFCTLSSIRNMCRAELCYQLYFLRKRVHVLSSFCKPSDGQRLLYLVRQIDASQSP